MTYLIVFGGSLVAGAVPLLAYVAYRAGKARKRHRVSRSRREKKISL